MKAHVASLINAIAMIALGLWGYFGSETPSPTAFIPVGFGIVLLALNNGVKKENKVIAHIAVLLTLIIVIALGMALKGAIGRGDNMASTRVGIMLLTAVLAIVAFIRSFIQARKNREAQS
ncbi:MAG: hypothetical protein AAF487_00130 [Bacteroidota bacterium]